MVRNEFIIFLFIDASQEKLTWKLFHQCATQETNQHYQDEIVNSSTKRGKNNRHRGLDPGSKTLSYNLKSQAVKSLRHWNHCFRGLMASSVAEHFKVPSLDVFFCESSHTKLSFENRLKNFIPELIFKRLNTGIKFR